MNGEYRTNWISPFSPESKTTITPEYVKMYVVALRNFLKENSCFFDELGIYSDWLIVTTLDLFFDFCTHHSVREGKQANVLLSSLLICSIFELDDVAIQIPDLEPLKLFERKSTESGSKIRRIQGKICQHFGFHIYSLQNIYNRLVFDDHSFEYSSKFIEKISNEFANMLNNPLSFEVSPKERLDAILLS